MSSRATSDLASAASIDLVFDLSMAAMPGLPQLSGWRHVRWTWVKRSKPLLDRRLSQRLYTGPSYILEPALAVLRWRCLVLLSAIVCETVGRPRTYAAKCKADLSSSHVLGSFDEARGALSVLKLPTRNAIEYIDIEQTVRKEIVPVAGRRGPSRSNQGSAQ